MLRRILVSLLLVLFSTSAFSGKGEKILKEVRANYEDLRSLELTLEYTLYKGYESENIEQQYLGDFRRNGSNSYRRIHNTEFISNKDYLIKVNHDQKMIAVSSPPEETALNGDLKKSLKWCKDVQVRTKGDNSVLSLVLKSQSDIPYSVVDIEIDKKFWIQQVTFYYSRLMDFSESYTSKDLHLPKLVVKYNKLKKKWKDKDGVCETGNYISEYNGKIHPVEKFNDYRILNLLKH